MRKFRRVCKKRRNLNIYYSLLTVNERTIKNLLNFLESSLQNQDKKLQKFKINLRGLNMYNLFWKMKKYKNKDRNF